MRYQASKNLVVVRCGDASLHAGWTASDRNWDLAVSYFGSNPDYAFDNCELRHTYKGGKWDGIHNFFCTNNQVLDNYDYFWFPDDDIATDCNTINKLFQLVEANEFELAQPSLSPKSYLSHLTCAWNPAFSYRNVNIIEIMVPLLDRRLLKKVLPFLGETKSGFGLDFVWNRFTNNPEQSVVIVDELQVTHTRPVGSVLQKVVLMSGLTSEDEEQSFLSNYHNVVKNGIVFGGRLRNGMTVKNRHAAALVAAIGWFSSARGRRGFKTEISTLRFVRWILRSWFYSLHTRIDLSPIQPVYKNRRTI